MKINYEYQIYNKHAGHNELNKPGHIPMKETEAGPSHQFHHRRIPFLLREQIKRLNTAE